MNILKRVNKAIFGKKIVIKDKVRVSMLKNYNPCINHNWRFRYLIGDVKYYECTECVSEKYVYKNIFHKILS